jgi:hypothetical protein
MAERGAVQVDGVEVCEILGGHTRVVLPHEGLDTLGLLPGQSLTDHVGDPVDDRLCGLVRGHWRPLAHAVLAPRAYEVQELAAGDVV